MNCRYCSQEAMSLMESVWFCGGCGRGESTHSFDPEVYDSSYLNSYLERGITDIGERINIARQGLVATFLPLKSRLIDYGCGAGDFLRHAKNLWDCLGVEANPESRQLVSDRTGVKVVGDEDLAMMTCDAITFFDSFEHLPDPNAQLARFSKMLSANGILVFTMPELAYCFSATRDEGYLARIFQSWRHAKPKEHLSYFTLGGFTSFLEQGGFRVVHTEHNESFLRYDPTNAQRNIFTVVAVKA